MIAINGDDIKADLFRRQAEPERLQHRVRQTIDRPDKQIMPIVRQPRQKRPQHQQDIIKPKKRSTAKIT